MAGVYGPFGKDMGNLHDFSRTADSQLCPCDSDHSSCQRHPGPTRPSQFASLTTRQVVMLILQNPEAKETLVQTAQAGVLQRLLGLQNKH